MNIDLETKTQYAKVMTVRWREKYNKEVIDYLCQRFDMGWKTLEPIRLSQDRYFQTVLYWPEFEDAVKEQPEPVSCNLIGKTVDDEYHGRGTIVAHDNGMVFVQPESNGCSMLVINESDLEAMNT